MDGSGRARKGDRGIRTEVWNRMVDASDIVHRSQINGGGANAEVLRAKNILLVRNDSGDAVRRGGVLAITGILTDPVVSSTAKESFFDAPTMSGGAPTASTRDFGIAVEEIRDGAIGRCALGGVVQLRVDVSSSDHKYATLGTSCSAMKSGGSGSMRLLWKEQGLGEGKWALGVFDSSPEGTKIGKATGVWGKNTYAQVTVYDQGDPMSPTAKDPPEVIQSCVNKFATVQADKWVAISKATNGVWYLVAAEC